MMINDIHDQIHRATEALDIALALKQAREAPTDEIDGIEYIDICKLAAAKLISLYTKKG